MAKAVKPPQAVSFSDFLAFFPEVAPPVTLGEETHRTFSRKNQPLSGPAIFQHILPLEDREADEYTEFVPCFLLAIPTDFIVLVYWRAALMSYYYVVVTYNSRGEFVDKRIIAGQHYDGAEITRSVALFTEDQEIVIASGQQALAARETFGAEDSTAYHLYFSEDGHILNE